LKENYVFLYSKSVLFKNEPRIHECSIFFPPFTGLPTFFGLVSWLLFLVVYAKNGQHWKLKVEISWLKLIIEKYVATFETSQLKRFEFHSGKTTFSDIIWAIK